MGGGGGGDDQASYFGGLLTIAIETDTPDGTPDLHFTYILHQISTPACEFATYLNAKCQEECAKRCPGNATCKGEYYHLQMLKNQLSAEFPHPMCLSMSQCKMSNSESRESPSPFKGSTISIHGCFINYLRNFSASLRWCGYFVFRGCP